MATFFTVKCSLPVFFVSSDAFLSGTRGLHRFSRFSVDFESALIAGSDAAFSRQNDPSGWHL
jgi:hypothetical protein